MFQKQKKAFRRYCMQHKYLYRLFIRWFRRRINRAMASARREQGIDDNMVLFCSYKMAAFNDNPYYISQALHALRPETDIVWMFRDVEAAQAKFDIPDYVRCVQWDTPEGLSALGRARVLVDNWRKDDYLKFSRRQIYLFSPHHDRSFKHGLFSCRDDQRIYGRVLESHAQVATIGSTFNRAFLKKAYHFKGRYLEAGLPRNDLLVKNDPRDNQRIRQKLNISEDTRILLYAPTFRDAYLHSKKTQTVDLDLEHVLSVLESTTDQKWIALCRAHYFARTLQLDAVSDSIRDVTDYPEMAELLRVADGLISDYSCCTGDFALRGKPIWLYISDIDDYIENSRKLYVNPLETPYWCARTPDELDALIRQSTPERASENCQAILNYYGAHETGHAAETAADFIAKALSTKHL